MYKITLVNMPFAALHAPSLALTQLSSVLAKELGTRVSLETLYLNQDFARWLGRESYQFLSASAQAHNSGLGEWLFRQAAFPELNDNTEEFLQRYFPRSDREVDPVLRSCLEMREGLDRMLEGLIDTYRIDQADLVGFTSMFSQNVASLALARRLKLRKPHLVTVIGGANCESPMGDEIARHAASIDFVFSGPGLKSFPEFVTRLVDRDIDGCHSIAGVLSERNRKQTSGDAASSALAVRTIGDELDIDARVPLDYDPFFAALDRNFPGENIKAHLYFETSRGCWWGERAHCTFCGLNGTTMAYRAMSAQRAREQFDRLFRYADRCSELQCVDNIMPKEYLSEVFPFVDPPENLCIFYEVKADLSDEELQTLATAGVRRVQSGIESLSTPTLKLMRKGMTAFRALEFLKGCAVAGIKPEWNLLVGFPGEPEDAYRRYDRALPLLTHLTPPMGAFPVRFDRYSPYFVGAREYGLELSPCDFYELIYPYGKDVLTNLAYYFTDQKFDAEYFVTMVRWIEKLRARTTEWQQRWQSEEGLVAPALCFKGAAEPTVIHDSRSGHITEHDVGEVGRAILDRLHSGKRPAQLATELPQLDELELARQIASLEERGLLFEERGRWLSLVLPESMLPDPIPASLPDATKERSEPALVPLPRKRQRRGVASSASEG